MKKENYERAKEIERGLDVLNNLKKQINNDKSNNNIYLKLYFSYYQYTVGLNVGISYPNDYEVILSKFFKQDADNFINKIKIKLDKEIIKLQKEFEKL